MTTKPQRHALIRRFVAGGGVHSQDELAGLLRREGARSTQATLSRDLRELGVLKGPQGYTLLTIPVERPSAAAYAPGRAPMSSVAPDLAAGLRRHLLGAAPAAGLVVLRTAPGAAPALALEIDRSPPPGVVGTVAGDDTVFVATPGPVRARALATMFRQLAGLQMPNQGQRARGSAR